MNTIEIMTDEELLKEFERVIKNIQGSNDSNEESYKERLKAEILKRFSASKNNEL